MEKSPARTRWSASRSTRRWTASSTGESPAFDADGANGCCFWTVPLRLSLTEGICALPGGIDVAKGSHGTRHDYAAAGHASQRAVSIAAEDSGPNGGLALGQQINDQSVPQRFL